MQINKKLVFLNFSKPVLRLLDFYKFSGSLVIMISYNSKVLKVKIVKLQKNCGNFEKKATLHEFVSQSVLM